ncbi:MAG: hypothetical protein AAFP28_00765 [Pseudomonadota bacterium]
MRRFHQLTRQALLAAFIALPTLAWAEVTARYEAKTVIVESTQPGLLTDIGTDADEFVLQVSGLASSRGMPFSVTASSSSLRIKPRFALRPGTDYTLKLPDGRTLAIAVPAQDAPSPKLVGFAPSQAVIPANTLRLYLHFSEPMARGQMRDAVRLLREDGTQVPSPFLTLGPELWDPTQTRVTLLLDPGRIKQGVGPNSHVGAPLEEGESYRLTVAEGMKSAAGEPLAQDTAIAFRVGPAERRAIAPETWQILSPPVNTRAPLTVAFDRIMDTGAVRRLIVLEDMNGDRVPGNVETDGGGWSLSPASNWTSGTYRLVIDPELEDVAGNTPGVPFDAEAGTIGTVQKAVHLLVVIGG